MIIGLLVSMVGSGFQAVVSWFLALIIGLGLGDVEITLLLDFLVLLWFSLACVLVGGWCEVREGAESTAKPGTTFGK